MAFIKFSTAAAESAWNEQRIHLGRPETVLQGKDSPIHSLPEDVLDELNDLELPFEVLQEQDLQEVLSERGHEYYQNLKRNHPESLYWDATLPPAQCIEVSFLVEGTRYEESREILERFDGFHIQRGATGATQRIVIQPGEIPSDPPTMPQKVAVRAFLPAEHLDPLVTALATAQIAGYDRETQVLVVQDPDRSVDA